MRYPKALSNPSCFLFLFQILKFSFDHSRKIITAYGNKDCFIVESESSTLSERKQ